MENKIFLWGLLIISIYGFGAYLNDLGSKSNSRIHEQLTVEVINPYAFATTPNAKNAAAFFKIANHTQQNDKLIHVWSDIAEINEIHENLIDPDDGTMMMRKIRELEIPKMDSVLLEPKGYHIMFINLKEQLNVGDNFILTLVFEKSGEQKLEVTVTPPGVIPEMPQPTQPHYTPKTQTSKTTSGHDIHVGH